MLTAGVPLMLTLKALESGNNVSSRHAQRASRTDRGLLLRVLWWH